MIIIGLADIHGQIRYVDQLSFELKKADIVFLVGDITHFAKADAARQVVDAVRKHSPCIRAVSGNCDYAEVDQYLESEEISLHGRGEVIKGIGCLGLGGSLTTPFRTPNEYGEDELKSMLKYGQSDLSDDMPTVLVSHTPPINTTCDRIWSGAHVGSRSVRWFIEKHKPLLCFTGHIHESFAVDRIGDTRIVNPGRLGEKRYAWAEIKENDLRVEIRDF